METLGVALYMGGGPSLAYATHVIKAMEQFKAIDQEKDENSLTKEEAEALVEKDMKVYNEGKLELAEEYIAENYVEHTAGFSENFKGVEGFKKSVTNFRTMYPDFNLTKEELIVKGNRIVWRWIMTGTNEGKINDIPPTGKEVRLEGVGIIRVANGKFVERLVYYNHANALKQLGFKIVPPNQQNE